MNDSITFLIVRHPFERLVSAYRDKIVFAIPHSYHDKLGHKIVRKYRKNYVSFKLKNIFYIFVTYFIYLFFRLKEKRFEKSEMAEIFRIRKLFTRRRKTSCIL